jgi:hypothetical protein
MINASDIGNVQVIWAAAKRIELNYEDETDIDGDGAVARRLAGA